MGGLLDVDGLIVRYKTAKVSCVDSVSLSISEGQVLGLVGESGCGKTTFAKAVLGVLPGSALVGGGSIRFRGLDSDLLDMDKNSRRKIQGTGIGMITQESLSSLNPVLKVGVQFGRLLMEKMGLTRFDAFKRAADFLEKVKCPSDILDRYPFQLSGGQRQRVQIAMAFALSPKLLIADEPTTALDVSIQAQVLKEIIRLREEVGTAILLISHNLGVVSQICDDMAVMYRGQLVEQGRAKTVLRDPSHAYTKGLIGSIPHLDLDRGKRLQSIPEVPEDPATGCRFAPLCSLRCSQCSILRPDLMVNEKGVLAACWSRHMQGA